MIFEYNAISNRLQKYKGYSTKSRQLCVFSRLHDTFAHTFQRVTLSRNYVNALVHYRVQHCCVDE